MTLIELVISLAVSMILLTAVMTTMHSFYRLRDRGEREIEFARSVTMLSGSFRRDLSQLTLNNQKLIAEESMLSASSVRERVLSFQSELSHDPLVFWGEKDLMAISNFMPQGGGSNSTNASLALRTIVWSNREISAWRLPRKEEGGNIVFVSVPSTSVVMQQRREQGKIQRGVVEAKNVDELTSLLPFHLDIQSLSFRYYDGIQWVNSWDSEQRNGLPIAVELTINCNARVAPIRIVLFLGGRE